MADICSETLRLFLQLNSLPISIAAITLLGCLVFFFISKCEIHSLNLLGGDFVFSLPKDCICFVIRQDILAQIFAMLKH